MCGDVVWIRPYIYNAHTPQLNQTRLCFSTKKLNEERLLGGVPLEIKETPTLLGDFQPKLSFYK